MDTSDYVVNLGEAHGGTSVRNWTGNDVKGASSHHGIVRTSESPLDLILHWTANDGDAVEIVGRYRLNLPNLLRDGYIRSEGGATGLVRLRFVHEGRGIYLRV